MGNCIIAFLTLLIFLTGCQSDRKSVVARKMEIIVVDTTTGLPVPDAEVVKRHNEMVGLSFMARRIIDSKKRTDSKGLVVFSDMRRWHHFIVTKVGYEDTIIEQPKRYQTWVALPSPFGAENGEPAKVAEDGTIQLVAPLVPEDLAK